MLFISFNQYHVTYILQSRESKRKSRESQFAPNIQGSNPALFTAVTHERMNRKPLEGLLLGLIFLYIYISPYTKVEESFNIQAVHDIATFGPFELTNVWEMHWVKANVV